MNEINDLMDADPLSLTRDNIDSLISHYRALRAKAASGEKAKRETGPKGDLSSIMDKLVVKKPQAEVKRRV